jgi:hypothetical protein
METQENYKPRIFKGAGILIGLVLGSVTGILAALLTGVIGIIGAIAASVAFPTGLFIEKKFQGEQGGHLIKGQETYLILFLIGVILFFICFFLVK